jgi:hypothetical protein
MLFAILEPSQSGQASSLKLPANTVEVDVANTAANMAIATYDVRVFILFAVE